jgi:DNA repair protein RecO (recombination protein O)
VTAIVKTDAIVLKSMKYRDTSRIVTLYTEGFGKIRGIAKGARGSRNKFGSALDTLARVHLVFYHKEHRDLHLVSQCDLRVAGSLMKRNLRRMAVGLACLELLDQVIHDREQNVPVFRLIDDTLALADSPAHDADAVLAAFKIRLSSSMGFHPQFHDCAVCGMIPRDSVSQRWTVDIARGAVRCARCDSTIRPNLEESRSLQVDTATLVRLNAMLDEPLRESTMRPFEKQSGNEIQELLRLYVHYHFDQVKPLRSEQLLSVAGDS